MSKEEAATPKVENGKQPSNLLTDIEAAMQGPVEALKSCRGVGEQSVEVDYCNGLLMPSMYGSKRKSNGRGAGTESILSVSTSGSTDDENYESTFTGGSDSLRSGSYDESRILYRNGQPVAASLVEDTDDEEAGLKIQMPPTLATSNGKTLDVTQSRNSSALSISGSQSAIGMSTTESFTYDGRPPPMMMEHSTSGETDDNGAFWVEQPSPGSLQSPPTKEHQMDPFAPRAAKSLAWRNVNMTVAGKGDAPDRYLLKGVYGEVPEHKTTAIMGAPGAG